MKTLFRNGELTVTPFGERGFTLLEILVAIAILMIGILGVAGVLALQSGGVAASLPMGHAAVTRGFYKSTATLLAGERLNQVRQLTYTVGPPLVDEYGPDPIPTAFPDENPVPGFPNFSREVRVQTDVPSPGVKTLTVTVRFNLPTDTRMNQESVMVRTLIAARP